MLFDFKRMIICVSKIYRNIEKKFTVLLQRRNAGYHRCSIDTIRNVYSFLDCNSCKDNQSR